MDEQQANNDLSGWYSTYGLITAERILGRYKIKLPQDLLLAALKNTGNFYHQVLLVPTKIVFNGIILQQAHDYQVYAQKILLDYLLSGETSKAEEAAGGITREDLNQMQNKLVELNDNFHQEEYTHNKLIAESQQHLIKQTAEWQTLLLTSAKKVKVTLKKESRHLTEPQVIQAINYLLIHEQLTADKELSFKSPCWLELEKQLKQSMDAELKQAVVDQLLDLVAYSQKIEAASSNFMDRVMESGQHLNYYRREFYHLILKVNELIQSLPEYHVDAEKRLAHRESLDFDTDIGRQ